MMSTSRPLVVLRTRRSMSSFVKRREYLLSTAGGSDTRPFRVSHWPDALYFTFTALHFLSLASSSSLHSHLLISLSFSSLMVGFAFSVRR
jgi:hypothetical protein